MAGMLKYHSTGPSAREPPSSSWRLCCRYIHKVCVGSPITTTSLVLCYTSSDHDVSSRGGGWEGLI